MANVAAADADGQTTYQYAWKITNFKLKIDKEKFKSEENPSLVSPRFGLPGWMWELRLHPRGDGPDNSGHISIYLAAVRSEREVLIDRTESGHSARNNLSEKQNLPSTWTRSVKYTISIPRTRPPDGSDAGNVYSGTSSNVFESSVALSWGWKKYLDRNRLDEALQADGSLLLNVEVKGEVPSGTSLVDLNVLNHATLDERECIESRKLLWSNEMSDVELRVFESSDAPSPSPVTIPAHRQVLALRSEYWRTMFTSGLRESGAGSGGAVRRSSSQLKLCGGGSGVSDGAWSRWGKSGKSEPRTASSERKPASSPSSQSKTCSTCGHAEGADIPATPPVNLTTIDIYDIPLSACRAMLEFLYTSKVVEYYPKTREEKYDVLMVADRYQLPGLHNLIGKDLAKDILKTTATFNSSEVLELLTAAAIFGGGECTSLRDVCMAFAKGRLQDIRQQDPDAFRSWCKEADRDLLAELLSS